MENIQIVGHDYVGILAGECTDSFVCDTIRGVNSLKGHDFVGGFCGEDDRGYYEKCYVEATIEGHDNVGGMFGTGAPVMDFCYSSGIVSSGFGLCGTSVSAESTITNCFTRSAGFCPDYSQDVSAYTNLDGVSKTIRAAIMEAEGYNDYFSASTDWSAEDGRIAGCPALIWHTEGIIFGGEGGLDVPPFVDEEL